MYSFQAKIGWKKMRNGENKNYRSVSFLLDAQLKIPKQKEKNSNNIQKYHYGIISSQNRLEKAEKERK